MIKKLIFVMLISTCLYSQAVYTYLIFRSSISKIVSESAIENYGYKLSDMATIKGQPFRITQFVLSTNNTNYLLLSIAPKASQWTMVHNVVNQGYAVLLSTYDTVNVWNQRYNCWDVNGKTTNIQDLPDDFYDK